MKYSKYYIFWLLILFIAVLFWNFLRPWLNEKKSSREAAVQAPYIPYYEMKTDQADLKSAALADLGLEERYAIGNSADKKTVRSAPELEKELAAAGEGAVIFLASGEYRVNLELKKNVNLQGEGKKTSLLARDENKPIVMIAQNRVSLENMVIKNGRSGLVANESDLRLKNIKFTNLETTAVYVSDGKIDFQESYIYDSGSGLKLFKTDGQIVKSIIANNKKAGVYLMSADIKILNNKIIKNGSYGIFADNLSKTVIESNYVSENEGFNVRIEGAKTIYR